MSSSSFHTRRDKTAIVAASIRNAEIRGKLAGAFIVLLGVVVGVLLSGFGIWAPYVSFISVTGALASALLISWVGAVALQRAPLAALLFSVPLAVGIGFAAFARHWWASGVLVACMIIPFAALTLFRFDQRKR